MSIATEITRIQTAKDSIKSAIIAKGGSVPSSAKLGDYATAISNLPTGGGMSMGTSSGGITRLRTVTGGPTGMNMNDIDINTYYGGVS